MSFIIFEIKRIQTKIQREMRTFPFVESKWRNTKTFEKVLGKNNANAYLNTPILNGHDRTWKGS